MFVKHKKLTQDYENAVHSNSKLVAKIKKLEREMEEKIHKLGKKHQKDVAEVECRSVHVRQLAEKMVEKYNKKLDKRDMKIKQYQATNNNLARQVQRVQEKCYAQQPSQGW